MIDNIKFFVPEATIQYSESSEIVPKTNGYGWKYRNLNIKIRDGGLVISGSLPKFVNNQNYTPLSHERIITALLSIQEGLGINLSQAKLYKFEVGTTIPVQYSPSYYLHTWGQFSSHYTKATYERKTLETESPRESRRPFYLSPITHPSKNQIKRDLILQLAEPD